MSVPPGKLRRLSDKVDISFDELAWSPDSQTLFLTGDQRGQVPIFTLTLAGNDVRTLVEQARTATSPSPLTARRSTSPNPR